MQTLDGQTQYNLWLCVAVRKKIHIYYWKQTEFRSFCEELSLPDTPKCISHSKSSDAVCVGFKREYYLIKVTA